MKYLLIYCLFLIASYSYAVEPGFAKYKSSCPYPQHEVGINYGYLNNTQFGIKYSAIFSPKRIDEITEDNAANIDLKAIGPIFIAYKYFFKEKLSVGFNLGYGYQQIVKNPEIPIEKRFTFHSLIIMPRLDFYYYRQPKFACYGTVSVGLNGGLLKNETTNSAMSFVPDVAYQFSPLCMRIGRKVGLVIELGFGTTGIASGGFSYRPYGNRKDWW